MTIARALVATAVLALAVGAPVDAQKASKRQKLVTVVNGRGKPLERLYASSIARRSWEEDILGDAVIAPGKGMKINFDDGSDTCRLDIRGVWSDGVTVTKRDVDVCATQRLVLAT